MELEAELGRTPSDAELADRMNCSREELDEMYKKSSVVSLVSLDDYLEQNHGTVSDFRSSGNPSPEIEYDIKETKQILANEINKLTEKERQVISLYYFEEMTVKEISEIMGVTESRISQIHSKSVSKLKMKLGKYRSVLF